MARAAVTPATRPCQSLRAALHSPRQPQPPPPAPALRPSAPPLCRPGCTPGGLWAGGARSGPGGTSLSSRPPARPGPPGEQPSRCSLAQPAPSAPFPASKLCLPTFSGRGSQCMFAPKSRRINGAPLHPGVPARCRKPSGGFSQTTASPTLAGSAGHTGARSIFLPIL